MVLSVGGFVEINFALSPLTAVKKFPTYLPFPKFLSNNLVLKCSIKIDFVIFSSSSLNPDFMHKFLNIWKSSSGCGV